MLKITSLKKGGVAHLLQLNKGDIILSFDGFDAVDELDYLYYDSQTNFTISVKQGDVVNKLKVQKQEDETLGIQFDCDNSIRTCHNNCVFCFVAQMPKGMRESLYVKDDDYKMSFMCGNFVTLTNVSDEEIDRIIRLKLSPIYVSVHTMNGKLREKLMRNKNAGRISSQLKRLAEGGVSIHAQAVIVPNENDGDELDYTARELFKLSPMVKTFAVVPTGITKFRENLTKIEDVGSKYSQKLLQHVERLNAEFGEDFIQPADEYFVKAKQPFKEPDFYGEFEQIENGVGLNTKFINDFLSGFQPVILKNTKKILSICGVSAYAIMLDLFEKAEKYTMNLQASVLYVENEFFGKTVTCTGLLTGVDIVNALKKHFLECSEKYTQIILPSNIFKEGEEITLDGMTLKEMKKQLNFKNIVVNYGGGEGLYKLLTK